MRRSRLGRAHDAEKIRSRSAWRQAVLERDGYICQARWSAGCTVCATEAHHVLPRGRGGRDELDNGLAVCATDHAMIHAYPIEAGRRGLLRSAGGNVGGWRT